MTFRTVLRRPGVGRLAAGGLLSELGDWMLFIALPVFVLQLTGSPLITATVFALELVPTVVVGPLVGVVIDRVDRWRLMTAVAAAQALCLLPLLAVDSADDLWLVYVVVVVESILGTVIEPARAAAAADSVPVDELMTVNGALGVLSSMARLVGAPLGGLVLGLSNLGGVVLVDGATFVAAAVLFGVRGRRRREAVASATAPGLAPGRSRLDVFGDWSAGIAVIARTPVLRRAMGVAACMGGAQGAFVVLFVLFVIRDLGGSEADVGLLRGVQALGGLAGGALLGLVMKWWDARRLTAVSLAAFGLLALATWNAPILTTALGVYVGLFVAVGIPGLGAMTGLISILQTSADESNRGRVMSTFFAVYGGVQALGMLAAGLLGTGTGLTVGLQVQGLLYLVAAGLALRLRTGTPKTVVSEPQPDALTVRLQRPENQPPTSGWSK